MAEAIVITPVKNSLDTTIECIKHVIDCPVEINYIVYNDFSDEPTSNRLQQLSQQLPFELINLADITDTPSPNYKLILQEAQKKALAAGIPLIVVESDVMLYRNTIRRMVDFCAATDKAGLVGCVTTDEAGAINYPYLKFKNFEKVTLLTKRSLSFCCTLFSVAFLQKFPFAELDNTKDWYDNFISAKAMELGFNNYVQIDNPVIHKPHSSRPWKKLKYSNPLKYYFQKILKRRDKI